MNGTIVIALAIIFTIVAIAGILIYAGSRETKKLRHELLDRVKEVAAKYQLRIERTEIFRNRVISLDKHKMTLLYVTRRDGECTYTVTDLRTIDNSEIVKGGSKRTETTKSGRNNVEEHISGIQLKLYAQKNEVAGLEFYNEIEDGAADMIENRSKAERWKTLIGDLKMMNQFQAG